MFFSQLAPEILEILSEDKLSYGVWVERSFKPDPRDELPEVIIESPDKMGGASAQTNYRKKTIRFNTDLFKEPYPPSLVFLIAHELAHYTGTNDEFYWRDDPSNEAAAQLLALEVLARGYFKLKEENTQTSQMMLLGLIRSLRHIFEQSAVYLIGNNNRNMDEYERYLAQLPNSEGREGREGSKNNPNLTVAKYYGYLPLELLLGGYNGSPLLFGNRERKVELSSARKIIPGIVGKFGVN